MNDKMCKHIWKVVDKFQNGINVIQCVACSQSRLIESKDKLEQIMGE